MEGLIPFVYRAVIQYRSGVGIGAAVYYAAASAAAGSFSESMSPSREGYVRLSGGDSGRFLESTQDVMAPHLVGGRGANGYSGLSHSQSGHLQAPLRGPASARRGMAA